MKETDNEILYLAININYVSGKERTTICLKNPTSSREFPPISLNLLNYKYISDVLEQTTVTNFRTVHLSIDSSLIQLPPREKTLSPQCPSPHCVTAVTLLKSLSEHSRNMMY